MQCSQLCRQSRFSLRMHKHLVCPAAAVIFSLLVYDEKIGIDIIA